MPLPVGKKTGTIKGICLLPACEIAVVQSCVYRRIRRLLEGAILFFTGLVIIHTWFVEGFPVFCQVQGGSMAMTLLGDHVDSTCPNCNFTFPCDAQDSDDTPFALCPNCGAKFAARPSPRVLAGDRVLIDRSAFQARRPRRWEVVAFHRSQGGQDLAVKRVVGLPGEKIQIIDGDIYANGQIQRKTLRQQRAMRILVHDDEYAGPVPRWRPQEAGSNWIRQRGRLAHAENTGEDIGWLVYNHTSPGSENVQTPARITDYGFYNRGRFQRSEAIHPMADVAMSFHIEDIHGRGLLWLQASDGRDEFMVRIDPGEMKYTVLQNRKVAGRPAGELPGVLRGQTIKVSLFDRQFLFAIAGRTLVSVGIDAPDHRRLPTSRWRSARKGSGWWSIVCGYTGTYAIRSQLFAASANRLRMAPAARVSWGRMNTSLWAIIAPFPDSRSWTQDRFVSRKSLVGKPFVLIFPSCEISLAGWHIQVPDLARIRYIR